MVSSPNDPARPTRVRRSDQMQSKAFGQIVNVANRQACTWLGYIDQLAPFKNRGHFLDPSSLVDSSSGESPPVEKAHIHLRPINPESLIEVCIYPKKNIANCYVSFSMRQRKDGGAYHSEISRPPI